GGPWDDARKGFVQQAAPAERWAAVGDAGQGHRAHQITRAADSYISDYAVPLVAKARQDPASARTVAVTTDGKRRVDALRRSFDRFMTQERKIFEAGQDRADAAARWAIIAASIGVAGTIGLILLSGGYLARSVVRPVRRA